MILFPAIDLKEGKVVRLKRGDYDQVTQYSQDPLEQARAWASEGAEWLHMVDLDAAKLGYPVNEEIITGVAQRSGLKVQVGGGIRTIEMAETYLKGGVSRVVVGTQAVKDPHFLMEIGEKFPGKVVLGLDTKKGRIAIQGWTQTTPLHIDEFLAKAPLEGIACLIFTDIARDGMLTGPNITALKSVMEISPIPVIASGGISKLEDIKLLRDLKDKKLLGVITGKALYEGKFSIHEALGILNT